MLLKITKLPTSMWCNFIFLDQNITKLSSTCILELIISAHFDTRNVGQFEWTKLFNISSTIKSHENW